MSASQFHALSAIAFQLAAKLECYEENVASMLSGPIDPESYRRASKDIDEMRMYAAALPPVSVAWVEVMIRHFELTHGLWRSQQDAAAVDLKHLHVQLRDSVRRLSHKCGQLMPSA